MNVWIAQQLNHTAAEVDTAFRCYDFAHVTTALYDFWIKAFCDVYLEWVRRGSPCLRVAHLACCAGRCLSVFARVRVRACVRACLCLCLCLSTVVSLL